MFSSEDAQKVVFRVGRPSKTTKNIARHGSIQVREQKEKFREAQQDLEGKLASLSQMIHSGEARALQIA